MPMIYEPLKCRPCCKDYLWGGTRLATEYGKDESLCRIAESWELSAHADGECLLMGSGGRSYTLNELAAIDKRGFWGEKCAELRDFPVLVKLIDAREKLSVQVHPSEETALPGEQSKTEAWYILDCKPQAYIYLGFSRSISREEFLSAAESGTVCELLNRVPVHRGDAFLIRPGTVHAIGEGILIAEVQQSSNTTFRIYDYGRGRPLHIGRAAAVLDCGVLLPECYRRNAGASFPEFSMSEIVSSGQLRLYRYDVKTQLRLRCDGSAFHHVMCIGGEGKITCGGKDYILKEADSYFLPASLGDYLVSGKCRFLLSTV